MATLDEQFRQLVNFRLEELDITRSDLARALGVSTPYVTQVLTPGRNVTCKTMDRWAKALDIHLELEYWENDDDDAPLPPRP